MGQPNRVLVRTKLPLGLGLGLIISHDSLQVWRRQSYCLSRPLHRSDLVEGSDHGTGNANLGLSRQDLPIL